MHNFNRFAQNQENLSSEYQYGEFAQGESPLNEMQEMELATELMEVTNEAELGQWVGKLFGKLKGIGRNFIKSPEGQQFGNNLRQNVSNTLYGGAQAIGQYANRNIRDNFPDPASGYYLGQSAQALSNWGAQSAGDALGLPPANDQQYGGYGDYGGYGNDGEMALEIVRYAADATRRFANSPYRQEYPEQAQRLAMVQAARRYMPQMVGGGGIPARGMWRLWRNKYIVVSL